MEPSIAHIQPLIQEARNCVLTTHVNPDGDGLGSELALAHFLRALGKNVTILNHSETPENYRWIDPAGEILRFSAERDAGTVIGADLIFVLDTNQPDRLRSMGPVVEQSKGTKIIFDHHLEPHPFGDHYIIDENATSTGEIIYRLIVQLNPGLIDATIAKALYTAIMTDTGSFRYPRTDPEIHRIASHLLEFGVVPIEVYANVYEQWSEGRMRLLGEVLNSMKTAHHGKVAYVICTQSMFRETGTSVAETDNFTTYPMSVHGVVVGILFNELHDGVKISFRSKGAIPINQLAKEFGGNGHLNAAGARLFGVSLDDTVKNVIEKAGAFVS